jgi:DUF4097 and DUF4098 domain-containing protein YvlB
MRAREVVAIVAASFVAVTAWAARPVSETVSAEPDGTVEIGLIGGTVEITGWDRDQVEVTGTIGNDVERLRVESDGRNVEIEVEVAGEEGMARRATEARVDLVVHVPRASAVEVESVSADVSVDDTSGRIACESVSSTIEIRGRAREIEASTVSGDIEVHLADELAEGEFGSVSGDLVLSSALAAGAELSFESVSGDVELHLPAETSARFSVETFSGKIENDFGPAPVQASEYVPAKSLSFTTGGGSASVEVESFSGRIQLRRGLRAL